MSEYKIKTPKIDVEEYKRTHITQEDIDLLESGKATPEQVQAITAKSKETVKRFQEFLPRLEELKEEFFNNIFTENNVKSTKETIAFYRKKGNLTDEELEDLHYCESYLHTYNKWQEAELEGAKERKGLLPDVIPTSTAVHFVQQFVNAVSSEKKVKPDKNTQISYKKKISKTTDIESWEVSRTNKKGDITISIDDISLFRKKNNKGFAKLFLFALQKCNEQNYSEEIGFPLHELVENGMYNSLDSARRGVRENIKKIMSFTFSGTSKKGNNTIKATTDEEGGKLIYHYRIKNNYVTLYINRNFNIGFIAQYFTLFPSFAYALSNNAVSLVYYIFYLARQNTRTIKEHGTFNISLEAVRSFLALPDPSETTHHIQLIKEPIEKAIEEIEIANNNSKFTITPYYEEYQKGGINSWLEGYLEIGLKGEYATQFIEIAENTAKKIESANKRKEKAQEKALQKMLENGLKSE